MLFDTVESFLFLQNAIYIETVWCEWRATIPHSIKEVVFETTSSTYSDTLAYINRINNLHSNLVLRLLEPHRKTIEHPRLELLIASLFIIIN